MNIGYNQINSQIVMGQPVIEENSQRSTLQTTDTSLDFQQNSQSNSQIISQPLQEAIQKQIQNEVSKQIDVFKQQQAQQQQAAQIVDIQKYIRDYTRPKKKGFGNEKFYEYYERIAQIIQNASGNLNMNEAQIGQYTGNLFKKKFLKNIQTIISSQNSLSMDQVNQLPIIQASKKIQKSMRMHFILSLVLFIILYCIQIGFLGLNIDVLQDKRQTYPDSDSQMAIYFCELGLFFRLALGFVAICLLIYNYSSYKVGFNKYVNATMAFLLLSGLITFIIDLILISDSDDEDIAFIVNTFDIYFYLISFVIYSHSQSSAKKLLYLFKIIPTLK